MSLDKGIKYGKEKRKPYYKSGKYDITCRPNGECPYCKDNRFHSEKIRKMKADYSLKEYEYDYDKEYEYEVYKYERDDYEEYD